ncbi:17876_t:CDS:2, partial [Cetraspora pellucida]
DYNEVHKRAKIEDWFRPCTPPHQIYSRNAYPPRVQERNNNESYVYDESSDLDNGKNHGEVNNEIDNIANEDIYLLSQELEPSDQSKTIRLEKCKKNINPLVQKYQSHLESKSVFDVISLSDTIEVVLEKPYTGKFIHKEHYDLIWSISFRCTHQLTIGSGSIGEVESLSNKMQRNETRQYKQQVSIGCSQDGIYSINVNAVVLEVGFLE